MSSAPPFWTAGVRRHVLPNGLTLLVQEDRSAPVVAVVTHVKAGFFDEPDRWIGISHVLEHMFFKGTERRGVGAIARETKSAGGYLNASTSYDHTSYFAVLPASGLEAALERHGYGWEVAHSGETVWMPDGIRDVPVLGEYLLARPLPVAAARAT